MYNTTINSDNEYRFCHAAARNNTFGVSYPRVMNVHYLMVCLYQSLLLPAIGGSLFTTATSPFVRSFIYSFEEL